MNCQDCGIELTQETAGDYWKSCKLCTFCWDKKMQILADELNQVEGI